MGKTGLFWCRKAPNDAKISFLTRKPEHSWFLGKRSYFYNYSKKIGIQTSSMLQIYEKPRNYGKNPAFLIKCGWKPQSTFTKISIPFLWMKCYNMSGKRPSCRTDFVFCRIGNPFTKFRECKPGNRNLEEKYEKASESDSGCTDGSIHAVRLL